MLPFDRGVGNFQESMYNKRCCGSHLWEIKFTIKDTGFVLFLIYF